MATLCSKRLDREDESSVFIQGEELAAGRQKAAYALIHFFFLLMYIKLIYV